MTVRPRLLLVTRNLPPLVGGMERLVHRACQELQQGYEVKVVGPSGCAAHLDPDVCIAEVPTAPKLKFLAGCLRASLAAAVRFRPQLVLSGSGVTAPMAWLAARRVGVPAATLAHGLDLVADNRLYQAAFLPFIRRCQSVIVNSRYTAGLAAGQGVSAARLQILHPGVAPAAAVSETDRTAFRQRIGAAQRPMLLSVGRLTDRKGMVEFVERCLPDVLKQIPDALLVIVGGDAKDALVQVQSVSARLRARVEAAGLQAHVRLLGSLDEGDLALAYASADVHVFPVREMPGDVEGFGMVALEAASHGVPTVAFAVGGVTDAVDPDQSGELLAPDDYAGMSAAIIRRLRTEQGREAQAAACRDHASRFYWQHYGARLRAICDGLLEGPKNGLLRKASQ